MAELYRSWRANLADALRRKEREGVVSLRGRRRGGGVDALRARRRLRHPGALGPDWDREAAFELGVRTARRLLGAAG